MTIHKSQGLTLNKVVIELGSTEFASGLSFVAMSRAKQLSGILFQSSFPISRLQRTAKKDGEKHLEEDVERRKQLGFTLNLFGVDMTMYNFAS
ncbi:hypothetical protein JAAARDRAFT_689661 [Jaapia argillacea MUCL 33604]|uniref:UvrD-like helicase C-terminal domain-containing protein n=1 Tax=Jaapia argillacea MUCL 33604 TaxID=933084 RepID=A0A067PSD7_9AGAM|nr:hypothetical protein JAAARDRAFT_689661 [Jaapia argillacea MUCL 33604]